MPWVLGASIDAPAGILVWAAPYCDALFGCPPALPAHIHTRAGTRESGRQATRHTLLMARSLKRCSAVGDRHPEGDSPARADWVGGEDYTGGGQRRRKSRVPTPETTAPTRAQATDGAKFGAGWRSLAAIPIDAHLRATNPSRLPTTICATLRGRHPPAANWGVGCGNEPPHPGRHPADLTNRARELCLTRQHR